MSKDSSMEPNAPPPYDSQMAPGQGGIYPQIGFQQPPQSPYAPPQGVQYNSQSTPQVVHVTQPVTVVGAALVGPNAVRIQCPSCQASIMTSVSYNANMKTHLCALVLCLLGCWPCVCVPYCMASCKDTIHKCPNCKTFLGAYKSG